MPLNKKVLTDIEIWNTLVVIFPVIYMYMYENWNMVAHTTKQEDTSSLLRKMFRIMYSYMHVTKSVHIHDHHKITIVCS